VTAAALVRAAHSAGVELRLVDGAVKMRGTAPPELREALRSAKAEVAALLAVPDWTDLDAWCARLGAAGARAARVPVLQAWVNACGGWSDAGAIHLPASLPNRLALATLRAHARGLGLAIHTDPDDPALLDWLRAAP
jgi:hypothetical protein